MELNGGAKIGAFLGDEKGFGCVLFYRWGRCSKILRFFRFARATSVCAGFLKRASGGEFWSVGSEAHRPMGGRDPCALGGFNLGR